MPGSLVIMLKGAKSPRVAGEGQMMQGLPASLLQIRAFLLEKLHERCMPGPEGGHPLGAVQSKRSEFLHAWMRRHGSRAFRTIRRARCDNADWTWCVVFRVLKSIDFPNQPFNLRPERRELVLHNIPDNFPGNTKVEMN